MKFKVKKYVIVQLIDNGWIINDYYDDWYKNPDTFILKEGDIVDTDIADKNFFKPGLLTELKEKGYIDEIKG